MYSTWIHDFADLDHELTINRGSILKYDTMEKKIEKLEDKLELLQAEDDPLVCK